LTVLMFKAFLIFRGHCRGRFGKLKWKYYTCIK